MRTPAVAITAPGWASAAAFQLMVSGDYRAQETSNCGAPYNLSPQTLYPRLTLRISNYPELEWRCGAQEEGAPSLSRMSRAETALLRQHTPVREVPIQEPAVHVRAQEEENRGTGAHRRLGDF